MAQKEAVYKKHTNEYANIKSYVRRYKKMLITTGVDRLYPADFDEFVQVQEESRLWTV